MHRSILGGRDGLVVLAHLAIAVVGYDTRSARVSANILAHIYITRECMIRSVYSYALRDVVGLKACISKSGVYSCKYAKGIAY